MRAEDTLPADDLQPLLRRYCHRCHGGEKPKGKIDLTRLKTKDGFLRDIKLTRKMLEAVRSVEMPPEDEKQPSEAERQTMARRLASHIDEYLRRSKTLRPVVMRRLNRFEYNNAVRDLLGLRGDIYPLPEKCIRSDRPYFDPASGRFPDTVRVGNRPLGKFQVERQILQGVVPFAIDLQSEHGFNNRGDELSVSPILLESLLNLGRSIVDSPQFETHCRDYRGFFVAPKDAEGRSLVELARKRLRPLLRRAFRGRVDEATVKRYTSFVESELGRGASFSDSMKRVVSAVLSSPRFLYLVERKDNVAEVDPVDGFELATRLSFFLWSSLPDDELLDLAEGGKLREPSVLQSQVRRMLRDPRCKALAENFARQWLRLDQLITAVPDKSRFPTYYSRIGCEHWKFGLQMMVEPLLLFESILVEDGSILLLVDSAYSYRSDELQTWYDSPDPFGNKGERNRFNTNQQVFKRRALKTRRQGGVITSAAVLTMTSSPLRTSPITRGAWVATVVFNKPPPPPPDDIPEIEADDAAIEAKGLTLRQRLEQHKTNQACAACHSKIDPLGFALENFDAVGRWRGTYRSGLKIDATGKLFGRVPFDDIVSFKDALLSRPAEFTEAFAGHLLSYALGRELAIGDEPALEKIVRATLKDGGRISTLITSVATSRPFLHKTNQGKSKSER